MNEPTVLERVEKGYTGITIEIDAEKKSIPFSRALELFNIKAFTTRSAYRKSVFLEEELFRQVGQRRVKLIGDRLRAEEEHILFLHVIQTATGTNPTNPLIPGCQNSHKGFQTFRRLNPTWTAENFMDILELSEEWRKRAKANAAKIINTEGIIHCFIEVTKSLPRKKQSTNNYNW